MASIDWAVRRVAETCCHPAVKEDGTTAPSGFVVDHPITFVFEHAATVKVEPGDQLALDLGNGIVRVMQVQDNLVHEIIAERIIDVRYSPQHVASLW